MHSKKLFFFDPQGAKKRSRSKRCVFGAKPPLTPFARTDRSADPVGAVWGPPHSSGPRDWGLGIAKDHVWQRQWSRMVSARGGPMESYGRPPARLPTNQQMYSCVTAATWGYSRAGACPCNWGVQVTNRPYPTRSPPPSQMPEDRVNRRRASVSTLLLYLDTGVVSKSSEGATNGQFGAQTDPRLAVLHPPTHQPLGLSGRSHSRC